MLGNLGGEGGWNGVEPVARELVSVRAGKRKRPGQTRGETREESRQMGSKERE